MSDPRASADPAASALRRIAGLVLVCGAILVVDVGGEIHAALIRPERRSLMNLLHLASELAATVALGWAFVLSRRALRRLHGALVTESERLRALRGEFDRLMQARFAGWGLSPAEADIALLSVRGLKIAEIAALRQTREGTIKAQLSSIFRKSGAASRTEFVARFVDEFLDHAAGPRPAASGRRADLGDDAGYHLGQ
ncbi:MAG: helix-turn-helix transcriptional regulator [Rhodobacteraceae bacterium]|jgi:DNA-binding CsgD family transcriptional regulator|nr:helix-turn-helix transcriptional regulator [Paracoccaceae bacterium]